MQISRFTIWDLLNNFHFYLIFSKMASNYPKFAKQVQPTWTWIFQIKLSFSLLDWASFYSNQTNSDFYKFYIVGKLIILAKTFISHNFPIFVLIFFQKILDMQKSDELRISKKVMTSSSSYSSTIKHIQAYSNAFKHIQTHSSQFPKLMNIFKHDHMNIHQTYFNHLFLKILGKHDHISINS